MPLQQRAVTKLTYKLKLTPQMRLDMHLLQMPLVKLKEFVKQQVDENPVLDMKGAELPAKSKDSLDEHLADEGSRQPTPDSSYSAQDRKKQDYKESLITQPATLAEHLLRQLHLLATTEADRKIGELIIGNLDDNGYLRCSVNEISKSAGTNVSRVKKVLFLIQTFDPIGIGSRDLKECLLLQLKAGGRKNSLTYQIVDKYLVCLEKKRYNYIAKNLKVSVEKIKEAMKEIAKLEPKPGRSFSAEKPVCLIPDTILRKSRGEYKVVFNASELPRITLNEKYKRMIKQKDTPDDARKYLRERVKAARSLINAVNRRKETVQQITESIVALQKKFLDKGVGKLKPMTLEQIANKIAKHKSTVSRAVSNKYLQTPWGIIELRYFLTSGVKQPDGQFISSKSIKSKIADLIAREKKTRPLTDEKIVELLKKQGISVARRTVAKYRKQLKILAALSRRE